MNVEYSDNRTQSAPSAGTTGSVTGRMILNEQAFRRMISLERKRTERSRKPFLLMLLDMGAELPSEKDEKTLGNILSALSRSTRETDLTGWYKDRSIVGVMFTEIGVAGGNGNVDSLITRVSDALRGNLTFEQFNQFGLSFHLFPEDWDQSNDQRPSNPTLYPDLTERYDARKLLHVIKRFMDIVGSLAALVLFSTLFLIIAIAIKATSKGPIFFRQRRVGQFGEPFVLLKFRTMHTNNDSRIHEEYVKKFITGNAEAQTSNGDESGVYKLTTDPRITRIGSFLRRTSLDELPQFINVLQGKMSLVGPRPPVPYEVETYDLWHRGRILEAKPGITGLWQVNGRSRVKFDDMVRLDLHYARTWSPWMDIKIMLRTPGAMFLGEGAH